MAKSTGLKIGFAAAAIPTLVLATFFSCHHGSADSHNAKNGKQAVQKAPEPPAPKTTEKSWNGREWKTASGWTDIYSFTNPEDSTQHCLRAEYNHANYACYPNLPGFKVPNGGILNLRKYSMPSGVEDFVMFDDPENPTLTCMGTGSGDVACHPKAGNSNDVKPK